MSSSVEHSARDQQAEVALSESLKPLPRFCDLQIRGHCVEPPGCKRSRVGCRVGDAVFAAPWMRCLTIRSGRHNGEVLLGSRSPSAEFPMARSRRCFSRSHHQDPPPWRVYVLQRWGHLPLLTPGVRCGLVCKGSLRCDPLDAFASRSRSWYPDLAHGPSLSLSTLPVLCQGG